MADPTKAWNRAFTSGSKEMQGRLMKVHAKNPAFQSWLNSTGYAGGESVKQASKEVAQSERSKELAKKSLAAYGATKGTRMGSDDGSGEALRDTIAPLTRDQYSKVQTAKREAKAKEVLDTKEKRLAFLKKLSVKPAVAAAPAEDFDEIGHDDHIDTHRSLHITGVGSKYSMDEEVEQINELHEKKEYTKKQLVAKVKSGEWDTSYDIKPGKHVEMTHRSGKKVTVYVKEEAAKPDASMVMTDQLRNNMISDKDKRTLGKVAALMSAQKNKSKKNKYVRALGLKAMKAGLVDPARGHSPTRFGREMLRKEEAELYEEPKDAADEGEYDYEGDMAKSQLRSIMYNAKRMHDMLEDNTNLPEWVQSKITLAEDYISTAANYMQGEMNEEVEQIDELVRSTVPGSRVVKAEISTETDLDKANELVRNALAQQQQIDAEREDAAAEVKARAAAARAADRTSAKVAKTADVALSVGEKAPGLIGKGSKLLRRGSKLLRRFLRRSPAVRPTRRPVVVPKPAPKPAPAPVKPAPGRTWGDRAKEAGVAAAAIAATRVGEKPVQTGMTDMVPAVSPQVKPQVQTATQTATRVATEVVPLVRTRPSARGRLRPDLMFPRREQQKMYGSKYIQGATGYGTFERGFEFGGVPRTQEFQDAPIGTYEEYKIEEKAMPGLSNLPSARKNKLARLRASKAAPVKEALDPVGKEDSDVNNDGKHHTTTDKYLANRRDAIRQAIKNKLAKKGGK